jgi:hypothetical protein
MKTNEFIYREIAGHLVPWLEPHEPFGKLDPQVVRNRKTIVDFLKVEYELYVKELTDALGWEWMI